MTQEAVIRWKGVIFNVEFEYEPFEKQTLEHQGQSEHITEISEFRHKGECFLEFTEDCEDEIKDLIYKNEL